MVIKPGREHEQVMSTAFLPTYIRRVIIRSLQEQGTPLDLQVGDKVQLRPESIDSLSERDG